MMRRPVIAAAVLGLLFCATSISRAEREREEMTEAEKKACQEKFHIEVKRDDPIHAVAQPAPQRCTLGTKSGFHVPDPKCTPGAVNPTLTLPVLTDADFKTGCVRDQATSEEEKKKTYATYGVQDPRENSGKDETCELDHFISLELGGADTLDNIWPQCGPDNADLEQRDFKQKDMVEDYLAFLVKNGRMSLAAAQKGIVEDWTQFLAEAKDMCPGGKCETAKLPPK